MDVKVGNMVSGTDIYGKKVEGKVISIGGVFPLATIQCGKDRLDKTVISFDDINNKK